MKFSSWIYRITYYHTISYFRKHKTEAEFLSPEDSEIIFKRIASDLDIKRELDQKLQRDKIESLLLQLDKKYRDVLILKFLEGKDYKEISDIVMKPMGTVATLLTRAKDKFKQILLKNNVTQ